MTVSRPPEIPEFDDQRNGCAFPTLAWDATSGVCYVCFVNIRNYRNGRLYAHAR